MSVICRAASARQKALESLRKLKYYINMNWEILHVTQYITNQHLRRLSYDFELGKSHDQLK